MTQCFFAISLSKNMLSSEGVLSPIESSLRLTIFLLTNESSMSQLQTYFFYFLRKRSRFEMANESIVAPATINIHKAMNEDSAKLKKTWNLNLDESCAAKSILELKPYLKTEKLNVTND